MAGIFRIELTSKEFDEAEVRSPSTSVLVEIFDWKEELKTKSGVVIGFNPDVQYAEGADNHIADVARVYGRIAKQPDKLWFHKKRNDSPPWEAELETEVGDYVWFSPLVAVNCTEIIVGERLYKVVPYEDLFVARKGGIDGEVVPLNGHVVMETMPLEKKSQFDVISEMGINYDKGRVVFVGKSNKSFQAKMHADHPDIKVGDIAVFDSIAVPYYLERNEFNMNFDEDKKYFLVQRHKIALVLR